MAHAGGHGAHGVRVRERPLDYGKKLPMIKDASGVIFEEDGGVSAPDRKEKKIVELPIPDTGLVDNYEEQLAARSVKFARSVGYIRRPALAPFFEDPAYVEYDLEMEDIAWLRAHPRWGEKGPDPACVLPPGTFEFLLTAMERASGTRGVVTGEAADRVPKAELERAAAEALYAAANARRIALPEGLSPALGVAGSYRAMFADVYEWWAAKRRRLGKPLLRRFWPTTYLSDNNPHHTFRPHEKNIRMRRTRRNDADAVRKLCVLREDLRLACRVVQWVKEREALKKAFFETREDMCEQSIAELCAVAGAPKRSPPSIEPTRRLLEHVSALIPAKPNKLKLTTGGGAKAGPGGAPGSAARGAGAAGVAGDDGGAGGGDGSGGGLIEVIGPDGRKRLVSAAKRPGDKDRMLGGPAAKKQRVGDGAGGAGGPGGGMMGGSGSGGGQGGPGDMRPRLKPKTPGGMSAMAPFESLVPRHASYPGFRLGPWAPPVSLSLHGALSVHAEEASVEPEEPLWLSHAMGLRAFLPATPRDVDAALRRVDMPAMLPSGNSIFPSHESGAYMLPPGMHRPGDPMARNQTQDLVATDTYYTDLAVQRRWYNMQISSSRWAGGLAWEEGWATGLAAGLGGGVRHDGSGWESQAMRLESTILPGDEHGDLDGAYTPSRSRRSGAGGGRGVADAGAGAGGGGSGSGRGSSSGSGGGGGGVADEDEEEDYADTDDEDDEDEAESLRMAGAAAVASAVASAAAGAAASSGPAPAAVAGGEGAGSGGGDKNGGGATAPAAAAASAAAAPAAHGSVPAAGGAVGMDVDGGALGGAPAHASAAVSSAAAAVDGAPSDALASVRLRRTRRLTRTAAYERSVATAQEAVRSALGDLERAKAAAQRPGGYAEVVAQAALKAAREREALVSVRLVSHLMARERRRRTEELAALRKEAKAAGVGGDGAAGDGAAADQDDDEDEDGESALTYRFRLGRGGRMLVDRLRIPVASARPELGALIEDATRTLRSRNALVRAQRAGMLRQWGLPVSSAMMEALGAALPGALSLTAAYRTVAEGGGGTGRFTPGDAAGLGALTGGPRLGPGPGGAVVGAAGMGMGGAPDGLFARAARRTGMTSAYVHAPLQPPIIEAPRPAPMPAHAVQPALRLRNARDKQAAAPAAAPAAAEVASGRHGGLSSFAARNTSFVAGGVPALFSADVDDLLREAGVLTEEAALPRSGSGAGAGAPSTPPVPLAGGGHASAAHPHHQQQQRRTTLLHSGGETAALRNAGLRFAAGLDAAPVLPRLVARKGAGGGGTSAAASLFASMLGAAVSGSGGGGATPAVGGGSLALQQSLGGGSASSLGGGAGGAGGAGGGGMGGGGLPLPDQRFTDLYADAADSDTEEVLGEREASRRAASAVYTPQGIASEGVLRVHIDSVPLQAAPM